MRPRSCNVYILASRSRRIYIGVTCDLACRLWRHRHGPASGFARRYGITSLVYVETFADPRAAIAREKQLKRWPRWRKDRLIDASNPTWRDLADAWARTDAVDAPARDTNGERGHRGRDGDPDTRVGSADAPAG